MFNAVGCFHFVEGYDRPVEALGDALAGEAACGSLIVLPEGFNNGAHYYSEPRGTPRIQASAILQQLFRLSQKCKATFIVGFLKPPFNSAALVCDTGCLLLAHKKRNDNTQNYVPWLGSDPNNPVLLGDVAAGVLICNEVCQPQELISALDACPSARKVLCIPACMTTDSFSSTLSCSHWDGKYVVLANSRPDGCGSFITNTRKETISSIEGNTDAGNHNHILLKTWPELDKPGKL